MLQSELAARGIPLACCLEPEQLASMRASEGQLMALTLSQVGQSVLLEPAGSCRRTAPGQGTSLSCPKLRTPSWMGSYAIPAEAFSADRVGAKSMNLTQLKGQLPDWIHLPASAALPFGTFEAVLEDNLNAGIADAMQALHQDLQKDGQGLSDALQDVRRAVLQLQAPLQLLPQLQRAFRDAGLPELQEGHWGPAWQAIKAVWASQWNNRAVVSMRRAGLDHASLRMAVLCQATLPAQHAFVSHTANPLSGDANEIYVEVVQGLGETLVGNHPGSAFSFVARKDCLTATPGDEQNTSVPTLLESGITITGFPSKSAAMRTKSAGSNLIFRSDSNGEDLEGYAGAGLFDSVQMSAPELVAADYSTDPLLEDEEGSTR
ncbi:hypothetical protein WJX84_004423 [Apatococcus fuscideae]|uniref:Pyruvate phosphate dikinase AMP/ATP-binding domain-containing protein n=1 Tax=Apatococcus fuscideae TaxID=2026836 RepID=A0AAW1SRA8_9CHLO